MTSPDIHALIGAYALDAVTVLERRQFEDHLTSCEACQRELGGLRETAARLGTAAATPPPPRLRAAVMHRIGEVRQLPPRVSTARRNRHRLLIAAAACLLLLGVVVGIAADRAGHHQPALGKQIEAVLSAPDATRASAPVTTGGTGVVVASRSLNKAVVIMTGLPRPPHARTYQLWLMGSRPPRGIGLMTSSHGTILAAGLTGTAQVGLTVEPAGGSPAPTSVPIFTVRLPV